MLEIVDLSVSFRNPHAPKGEEPAQAVRGVSLSVEPGEIVGLVGESGSGKSVTCHAALGLLPDTAECAGEVRIDGTSLLNAPRRAWRGIRGSTASIVLQDPFGSLNPLLSVGTQLIEAVRANRKAPKAEARTIALDLLAAVGLPDGPALLARHPHELSGGMCQRVVVATALAGDPRYLLADEATTALDVTVQAQVVELIATLARERGMGVLFVTHDLGVAAALCTRIDVMQHGKLVESAPVDELFRAPQHPYTRMLLDSLPARLSREQLLGIDTTTPQGVPA